jgi:hypothetical protein
MVAAGELEVERDFINLQALPIKPQIDQSIVNKKQDDFFSKDPSSSSAFIGLYVPSSNLFVLILEFLNLFHLYQIIQHLCKVLFIHDKFVLLF